MKLDKADAGGSEKARMAEKLLESEARLQFFSAATSEGIIIHEGGRIVDVNQRGLEIYGYQLEEMIGMDVAETWAPEDRDKIQAHILAKTETLYEAAGVRKDGSRIHCEVIARNLKWNGKHVRIALIRDMTDRKKRETELRRAEKERSLLISAVEQSAEVIIITDTKGIIEYVNSAFSKITGYWKNEALGRDIRFLRSDRQERGFHRRIWQMLAEGNAWKGRLICQKKDGGYFTSETSISPIFDPDGVIVNYIGGMHDVSAMVKLEEQYQQSQKMETIGTLAGGIAHDFNNILYAAMGFTELAYNDVPKGSRAAVCLESIMASHKRASDLINQILTFSRQNKQDRKPIRIQPALKEAVKLIRKIIPTNIEIRQKINADCGPILADAIQIHQIVMNLCTNAFHAMQEKGGVMTIRLDSIRVGPERSHLGVSLEPGYYIVLEVADTGVGMDAAVLKRIFEPFFTTKEVGKGTGLGLATVHGIVKEYDGVIHVTSEPGRGSSFFVFFPACPQEEVVNLKAEDLADLKGTERILFVDDDEMIVRFAERSLKSKGYDIHSRSNGMEALEAFRADPHRYDVVVTDMNMPRMTGTELAEKILQIRPEMPIILCTGFSEAISKEKMQAMGIVELLYKPVITKKLLKAIRTAMDKEQQKELNHEANSGD